MSLHFGRTLLNVTQCPEAETLLGQNLKTYKEQLEKLGLDAGIKLGYGNPKLAIPDLVKETGAGLLVMGAHGHTFLQDLFLGTTLSAVRHRLRIPVVIVR